MLAKNWSPSKGSQASFPFYPYEFD